MGDLVGDLLPIGDGKMVIEIISDQVPIWSAIRCPWKNRTLDI